MSKKIGKLEVLCELTVRVEEFVIDTDLCDQQSDATVRLHLVCGHAGAWIPLRVLRKDAERLALAPEVLAKAEAQLFHIGDA